MVFGYLSSKKFDDTFFSKVLNSLKIFIGHYIYIYLDDPSPFLFKREKMPLSSRSSLEILLFS